MAAPLLHLIENGEELGSNDGISIFEIPPLGIGFTEEVRGNFTFKIFIFKKFQIILFILLPLVCVQFSILFLQLIIHLDQKLAALGSERERSSLLDIEKREQIVGSTFLKASQLNVPLSNESFDVKFPLPAASSWSYNARLDGSSIFDEDIKPLAADNSVITDLRSAQSSTSKNEVYSCMPSDGLGDKNTDELSSPVDTLSASIAASAAASAADAVDDYNFIVNDYCPSYSLGFNAVSECTPSQSTPSDEEKNYSPAEEYKENFSKNDYDVKMLPPDDTGTVVLRVVFDGVNRAVSDFKIKISSLNEGRPYSADVMYQDTLKGSADADLKRDNADDVMNEWVQRHLIGVEKLDSDSKISISRNDMRVKSGSCAVLDSYEMLDDSNAVLLGDKVVRPNIEDDVICRMIHIDQLSYKAIMNAAGIRLKSIMQSDIRQKIEEKAVIKDQWADIEALYLRQRTWRKVATTAAKGMREHTADFNKSVAESVPASWAIRVDGRPPLKEEEEEVKEGEEDAVCMCCFDGSSLEGNRIMFCDGCNAAVHQACYGVQEIPDGDFFCDRCRAIQVMADTKEEDDDDVEAFDPDKVRDVIKCCMCPLYHGGFKPTTDGRWIHMCCALWSDEATILDINEMTQVDVSGVKVQECRELEPENEVNSKDPDLVDSIRVAKDDLPVVPAEDACMYCGAHGGYVVRCGGSCAHSDPIGVDNSGMVIEEKTGQCDAVFHPLCAWFQGIYLQTKITDPTFQGHNRGGLYPSGLSYLFLCDNHCPESSKGVVRERQILLRRKYQINVDDLDQIPGKIRSKRKKKRPVPVPKDTSHSRSALGSGPSKIKDLNRDVYDIRICAICLSPMECAFPHSLLKPISHTASKSSLQLLLNSTVDADTSSLVPGPASGPIPALMHPLSTPMQLVTPYLEGNMHGMSFPSQSTISPFADSSYQLLGNTLPSLIHQANNCSTSLQPFSQIFPDALLPGALTAVDPRSLNTYTYPDNFNLPAFTFSPPQQIPLNPNLYPALIPSELPALTAGNDCVKAALDALFSCDGPPSEPPAAAFFHRLTCSECGINVHLGCHHETGGSKILDSNVMKGILYEIM